MSLYLCDRCGRPILNPIACGDCQQGVVDDAIQARLDSLESLLRESKRAHVHYCKHLLDRQLPCNCTAGSWNARIDAVLAT